jgi:hypothetical protein
MTRGPNAVSPNVYSPQLNAVSVEAEWTFMRILPHLDVEGRIHGAPPVIRAQCFPLRVNVTLDQIEERLAELHAAGLIVRYEVDGIACISFPGFRRHQRRLRVQKEAPSRLPALPSAGGPDQVRTRYGPGPPP